MPRAYHPSPGRGDRNSHCATSPCFSTCGLLTQFGVCRPFRPYHFPLLANRQLSLPAEVRRAIAPQCDLTRKRKGKGEHQRGALSPRLELRLTTHGSSPFEPDASALRLMRYNRTALALPISRLGVSPRLLSRASVPLVNPFLILKFQRRLSSSPTKPQLLDRQKTRSRQTRPLRQTPGFPTASRRSTASKATGPSIH
jgi:hypothetical protein